MKKLILIKFRNLLLIGSVVTSLFLVSCKKDDTNPSEEDNNPPTTGETGSFTDNRDGKVYEWVKIGNQVWMAENLNYEYGNSWTYNNTSANGNIYGRLYDWNTALTVSPNGWHLPTNAEWAQLTTYLEDNGYSYDGVIGNRGIAKSLAANNGWKMSNFEGAIGNSDFLEFRNVTGFSALPGGYRVGPNVFDELLKDGNWWTASELDADQAYYYRLHYSGVQLGHLSAFKSFGYSIRCIRD
jgi:uncharacterized protein (TIGR02145 family)